MKTFRLLTAGLAALVFALLPIAPSWSAALTITAANVAWQDGPIRDGQVAGEAFSAGALVYLSASNTWLKAQDDGTAAEAGSLGLGVALSTADASGARVSIAVSGSTVSLGTGTAAVIYTNCDAAGGICPSTDNAGSTDKISIVGVGVGSNKLYIAPIYNSGSVIP